MTEQHPFFPQMEYAFTIAIKLSGPPVRVQPSVTGQNRAIIHITEGTITGPMLQGRVVPMSGADWAQIRPDGTLDFDARYTLELDDGTPVYMQNRGFRWGSPEVMAAQARREPVPFDAYYMRVTPRFEVAAGPHEWLAKHVFVGVAEKLPEGNAIHYFVVR
ncbi:DUF3237 domain-containing protein [Novosphingobium sediminicola]|uniref:UPF0311 protein GGR38_000885 n=1 Tax=Novosphingobium sediminicola TaxID=563162 RepID=A0A7W6CCD0_9SPHN|nr:DUF3237 domain-containing protein [Novosphingobium sediminicola]MBB3953958.1 hypothetical protein [Novosphingobium sediminicola]